jgi:hypothetical protein
VLLGGIFLMIMSADTERLTAAIGRQLQAIAARFRHPAQSGLPTGRADAESAVKGYPNRPDISPEDAKAMQAFLPIGPSCC